MAAATVAGDAEIKRLVTKTLEAQGVLGQIKAQLRAAVYSAIHDVTHEPTKAKRELLATSEASLALKVVVEFLRQFNLHQTLSVLAAEASLSEADLTCTRQDVAASLNLTSLGTSTAALLTDLIRSQSNGVNGNKLSPASIEPSRSSAKLPDVATNDHSSASAKTLATTPLDLKPLKSPSILGFASQESKEPTPAGPPLTNAGKNTSEKSQDDDDGDDDDGDDEDVHEESIASSVHEASYSMDNEAPEKPAARQVVENKPSLKPATETKANELPPSAKSSLSGSLPHNSKTAPPATQIDLDDEEGDPGEDDDAERLRALEASLKAMEAEDDTGTLSKLKASLQHELEAKSDDDDGGHYGSDFEEDFEEDVIASDVEEDDDTAASNDERGFQPAATDKPVSRAVLDAYDHVEDVIRP